MCSLSRSSPSPDWGSVGQGALAHCSSLRNADLAQRVLSFLPSGITDKEAPVTTVT